MTECRLTTTDNPYNPFTQFQHWFMLDELRGYHTCSHIARLDQSQEDWSSAEIAQENERVCDFIIDHDTFGVYRKVTRETDEDDFDDD